MTICTKHRYGGPHACPYCERDTARAETERLRERVQSLAAWLAEPGRYVTPKRAAELVQALTSDPEPTT